MGRLEEVWDSMEPKIGLEKRDREGVVEILRRVQADEFVLYTKTLNYHWNIVGPEFTELHRLFEEQYEALDSIVDEVAERARVLGERAIGTLAEFSKYTRLKEAPGSWPTAREMVEDLLGDHEALVRSLRKGLETCLDKYHDTGTNNFLTDLMNRHEKTAWMLRAHLGKNA